MSNNFFETPCSDISYEPLRKKMRESRESLSQQLKERRNSKCTKQISVQEQLLTLAKEDAKTKQVEMEHRRRLLDQFEASEKNFTNTMQLFSENISRTMTQGFMMMQSVLQGGLPMPPVPNQHNGPRYAPQWQQQNFHPSSRQVIFHPLIKFQVIQNFNARTEDIVGILFCVFLDIQSTKYSRGEFFPYLRNWFPVV